MGHAHMRVVGATLSVKNATLRVGDATGRERGGCAAPYHATMCVVCATGRVGDATRRVVGATCREHCCFAAIGRLVPVVELEPAGDGFSSDSNGEENVLASPVSIGTLRAVVVYRKRDCRRD